MDYVELVEAMDKETPIKVSEVVHLIGSIKPSSISVTGGRLEIILPPGDAPRSCMGVKISLNGEPLTHVRSLTLRLDAASAASAEVTLYI